MKIRLTFFLVFISMLLQAYAQDSIKQPYYNTDFITSYRNLFTTRLYFLSEGIDFIIDPTETDINVKYGPSNNVKMGIAVFHKWFGVGIAFRNPIPINPGKRKPEKSSVIDLRVNAYGTAVSGELTYQDYKGFYLTNPEDIYADWNEGDYYPYRDDIRITAMSAIIYYLPNFKKHSTRAAYIQTERQIKSSGSPVIAPAFIHLGLNADSSLIPSALLENFPNKINEGIIKGKFTTVGISAGYSYTFVFFKYFYVNLSFLPGLYYHWYNYETDVDNIKSSAINVLWTGRSAIGYNSDKFYTGISGVLGFIAAPLAIGHSNYNLDMNQFRFWVGTRFNLFKKKKNKKRDG